MTDDTRHDHGDHASSGAEERRDVPDGPAEWQDRLAVPVLIAALASIPAVFLTLFDGAVEVTGNIINTLSGIVLVAEAVVLFAVSEQRWQWVKDNRWLVLLALAMVPAVVFAVGPVQLLRLLRTVGALRIIRARRIFSAGRVLRRRAGLDGRWHKVTTFGVSLLVAGFVAVVLADPTSESRQFVDQVLDAIGPGGALVAGLLLAVATFVVVRYQAQEEEQENSG